MVDHSLARLIIQVQRLINILLLVLRHPYDLDLLIIDHRARPNLIPRNNFTRLLLRFIVAHKHKLALSLLLPIVIHHLLTGHKVRLTLLINLNDHAPVFDLELAQLNVLLLENDYEALLLVDELVLHLHHAQVLALDPLDYSL